MYFAKLCVVRAGASYLVVNVGPQVEQVVA